MTAVMMYLEDITKQDLVKLNRQSIDQLASRIHEAEGMEKPQGKSTSGGTLEKYYRWWRDNVCGDVAIRLDPRRDFDAEQKNTIWQICKGTCAVCGKEVTADQAEYDHYPKPYGTAAPRRLPTGDSFTSHVIRAVARLMANPK